MIVRKWIVLLVAASAILAGCAADPESERIETATRYLAARKEISPKLRTAIQSGRILLGMAPDEASVAGGAFIFIVEQDQKVWPKQRVDPWDVLAAQRLHPDDSKITLRFANRTQFGTKGSVPFAVDFARGRVVQIRRETTDRSPGGA